MGRDYDRKEVEEILRRAVRDDARPDGIPHEDLVAAAAEVGIDEKALERAALEVLEQQRRSGLLSAVRRRRKRRLLRNMMSYAVLAAGAYLVDEWTSGGPWAHWVAAGLGILLIMRIVRAFAPSDGQLESELAAEERRRQHQEERRARRSRRRADRRDRKRREDEVERIFTRGVDALLRVASRKLDQIESPPQTRVRVEQDTSPCAERTSVPGERSNKSRRR